MSAETVPVKEEAEEVSAPVEAVKEPVEAVEESSSQEEGKEEVAQKETNVPLHALQKERKKRQELEIELRLLKEQQAKPAASPQEDESRYEAVTKEELGNSQKSIIRAVEERAWIKDFPERAAEVNEKLGEFLKQRPNLASAIESSTNRYEEAWELMDKLSPKQKSALRPVASAKKDAPGSPSSVPKAAAINQAVDFSGMTDAEFNTWRQQKRKKR